MGKTLATKSTGSTKEKKAIKCVVWDLDNTLWDGVLLENKTVSLRPKVVEIIKTLDRRGILQSIASRNDYDAAMQQLQALGLADYFLYPQLGWGSKVSSIKKIARQINIGLEAVVFIDDQPFERDEVRFSLPEVRCFDAADLDQLLDLPEMKPRFVTRDSGMRRLMYRSDMVRNQAEEAYVGPKEAFLASLGMVLTIFSPREEDLQRAEELTVRTNQLNSTGYTYSYDQLNYFRHSNQYQLLMASLEDKYGPYGHIGLALVACDENVWTIKLLLMSCRVMARGVGSIMLTHLMNLAREKNVRLRAEFMPNGRNRMMNITYRFAGFNQVDQVGDLIIFETDLATVPSFPDYVTLKPPNLKDKAK
jgi:FkbH-like protein